VLNISVFPVQCAEYFLYNVLEHTLLM
jgi:hypothetical protein